MRITPFSYFAILNVASSGPLSFDYAFSLRRRSYFSFMIIWSETLVTLKNWWEFGSVEKSWQGYGLQNVWYGPAPFDARQYSDGGFILYFDRFWLEIFYPLVWDTTFVIKREGSRRMLIRNDRHTWNELTTERAKLSKHASEEIVPRPKFFVKWSYVFGVYGSEFLYRRRLKNESIILGWDYTLSFDEFGNYWLFSSKSLVKLGLHDFLLTVLDDRWLNDLYI
jgi:hypothetical protein